MALKVVIDTNIFLSIKNKEEPFNVASRELLDKIDGGTLKGIVSTIVVAEMCSGYHASGELREKEEFLTHILTSPNYKVVDVTATIADEAGRIRASTGLRLPDSVIVATGLKENADYLVTYDDTLRKGEKVIKIASAKELLARLRSRK